MKQVYRVPFERNSERVKELRYNYVQRVLELEVDAVEHQFFFIDEVGFNLTKRRRRGRNIIGQRAIVEVPGQRGGNITMCAAMTDHGIIHHHATLGPYNTAHLITFLDTLHNTLIPPDQIDGPEQLRYVVIWDNVSFHRVALVHNCEDAVGPISRATGALSISGSGGSVYLGRYEFTHTLWGSGLAVAVDGLDGHVAPLASWLLMGQFPNR
ncbi:uncharacterized protein LOC119777997 [Cyprinodon tularosa]|uniref:uncharacterized protein LOC119777997 n=1 Tax=Cyprinodon tularosa TaxID=77115 RepID=UPI0018E26654|nr:uncharacterized protein LOC119777997 [Cyprinodon tularosa]